MKIRVLTIARTKARQETMARSLGELGLDFEFFLGLDASLGEHKAVSRYDETECLRVRGAPLGAGEIACFAGHYLLWQKCRAEGVPSVIMEDDLTIDPGFVDALKVAESRLSRYPFIRFGGSRQKPYRVQEAVGDWQVGRFLKGPLGAHAYMLSPQGAASLLAKADRWFEPVDVYIDAFWRHGIASIGIFPLTVRPTYRGHATSIIGPRMAPTTRLAKLRRQKARLFSETARAFYNLTHH